MKLSIAIADTKALQSAFVVFRGFHESIPKAAKLGYHGVELALRRVEEINMNDLDNLLNENNLEISCISTGQVFADGGLVLTHDNESKRREVKTIFKGFIDMAADYGQMVNIGRVRGTVAGRDLDYVEGLFVDSLNELCEYALRKNVTIVLEPVNRYECDFINTLDQAVRFIRQVTSSNLRLLPDVFHMNIEERDVSEEITKHINFINYIHFADSNRLAPGQGHLDFNAILNSLYEVKYDGWISTEILPRPSPDTAATQAIEFLRPLIQKFDKVNATADA